MKGAFMSSPRYLLFLAVFLTAAALPAHAQDDNEPPCGWGYLFNWKPNFDIGKVHVGSVYNRTNEKISLMGIGVERFLNDRWGLQANLDVGVDNSSQEDSVRTIDNNVLDLGLRLGVNYYFHGKDKRISPYFGGWASYSMLTEKLTDTPVTGNAFENKYSASSFGIGVTGGIFWQPWADTDFDFGFNYNFGAMISPKTTLETTSGGQTVKTEGPSRLMLGDCGAQITARFSF
jgi:outer membrane protein W